MCIHTHTPIRYAQHLCRRPRAKLPQHVFSFQVVLLGAPRQINAMIYTSRYATHGLSWCFRIQGLGGFHPVPWYNSNCTKERSSRTIQVPGWNPPSPRPLKHQLSPCVDMIALPVLSIKIRCPYITSDPRSLPDSLGSLTGSSVWACCAIGDDGAVRTCTCMSKCERGSRASRET